ATKRLGARPNESCGHLGKQFTHLSLKGGYDQSSIAISFSVVSSLRCGVSAFPLFPAGVERPPLHFTSFLNLFLKNKHEL
ncbi:hypothetical protein, partial [Niallia sp. MER TA 168]|uniref:hypothetical protein n=1 Tax=Niallia sp. MER TA 168 TaxID=2939568 RepID=UPI00204118EF